MTEKPAVLVLGASRGLGLGLAQEWCRRGWRVIATKRSASAQLEALASQYPDSLEIETADIADAGSVRALGTRLAGRRLDVLFVNAGIGQSDGSTPAAVDEAEFARLMLTNALGPVRAIEILEALVPPGGVIAAMSSQLASIANNSGFWELYSASKAALNMLMKCFAGGGRGTRARCCWCRPAGCAPIWAGRTRACRLRRAREQSCKWWRRAGASRACGLWTGLGRWFRGERKPALSWRRKPSAWCAVIGNPLE